MRPPINWNLADCDETNHAISFLGEKLEGRQKSFPTTIFHLNTRNMLIRDELIGEGSIDEAPVYVREVIRRAMELKSAAIILVHNHPRGDPSPSRADIDLTRSVIEAGKKLGIAVHDHIIIGTKGFVSLRGQGLI